MGLRIHREKVSVIGDREWFPLQFVNISEVESMMGGGERLGLVRERMKLPEESYEVNLGAIALTPQGYYQAYTYRHRAGRFKSKYTVRA